VSYPVVSVVVPTRNRAHLLGACLDALTSQTVDESAFEIVVVDNGSTDATADVVRSRGGNVSLVQEPIAGVNRARNAGLRAARGSVIAFIDDDELVAPDYVRTVSDVLARHPQAAGAGGPAHEGPIAIRTCGRCSLGAVAVRVVDGWADGLLGGNMAIRRTAFDTVGPFDEQLSGRGDETEWFARAAAAGLRFAHEPALSIEHRRDVFTLRQILVSQFRQGRARPLVAARLGERYRPRLRRAGGALVHALTRRCAVGLARFASEAGSTWGWAVDGVRRRADRPRP